MTPPQNDAFVPLTSAPASPGRDEFQVRVVPKGGQSAQPVFKVLGAPPPAPPAPEPPVSVSEKICEPSVSVLREGDRVAGIRVQCSCGKVMDIACVYGKLPPAA